MVGELNVTKGNPMEFIVDAKQHLNDRHGIPVSWGTVGYTRYVGFADQATREALELRLAELGDFLFHLIRKYTDKFYPDRVLIMYGACNATFRDKPGFSVWIELVTDDQDYGIMVIDVDNKVVNCTPHLGTDEEVDALNNYGTALCDALLAAIQASS